MKRTNLRKVFASIIVLIMLVSGEAFADDAVTIISSDNTSDTPSGTLVMTLTINPYATVTTAPASKDLTYTGTSQDLITSGAANGGTMVYATGNPENLTYSTDIPQKTNAGKYLVWYKVSADTGYRDSKAVSLDAFIGRANPIVTAPTSKDLTYTGSEQELINAGTVSGGTLGYGLGKNAQIQPQDYTSEIPTGTNPGTYYVWWRVEGNDNYDSVDPTCITVTMKLDNYTITYYGLTGSTGAENNPTSYNLMNSDITLANPSKNGYTFDGWTGTGLTAKTQTVTIPTSSSGDRSYTANWSTITYTISYDLGGGSLSGGASSYDIETTITLPQPVRDGYDFEGWLLSGDTSGTLSTDVTIPNGTTGNREYVAQWSPHIYTLSYDLDGGTVSPDNPTSYTIESDDIILTSPDKTAYDFAGWVLSGDSDWEASTDVTIPSGSSGDRTYSATWTATTYAISYDLNGGSLSSANPVSYDIESADIKLNNPTRTGYTFAGWMGTGLTEASTDVTIPHGSSGDRTYSATWTATTYAISYDLNSGSLSAENPVSYDIESADIKLNNPTRTGYTFAGWTGTGLTEASTDVTIPSGSSGDRTYSATWTATTYAISYDLNSGSLSSENPVSYDIESADIKLNNPTRTGYTFAGWTGTGLTEASTDVTIPSGSIGDRSYTATWTTNEFTISYTLNNGSVTGNPTSYTIETATFTLNNPAKVGYQFDGWTGTDLSGQTQTVTIAQGSIGDRSYTANFTPITYTITYELNGGTNDAKNPDSYTIESPTITLKDPTREDYDFGGWTYNGEPITEIMTGSIGDRTLTATWGETQPVISPESSALTAYKGQPVSLTLNAVGTNLEWSLEGILPAGLAFTSDGNTAEISGTPEAGTSGSYGCVVTVKNEGGSATANIEITVASDFSEKGSTEAGSSSTTTENGMSRTTKQTVFKNGAGSAILTSDIAITTEAENFEATAGKAFTTTVGVDVTINLSDPDYKEYGYAMEIAGLPEWLSAEGGLGDSSELSAGTTNHHHEFVLTGTPETESDAQTVTFNAAVRIAGDTPTLEAYGEKTITISVLSSDASPDVSPDISPDISPDTSLDVLQTVTV